MDPEEESRINQMLASVEREEMTFCSRPTGAIVRQLFSDESEGEQDIDFSDEDDDGFGIIQEIQPDLDRQNNSEQPEDLEEIGSFDDFDDIEEIPLAMRRNSIVTRRNGKNAYVSKDGKVLWDLVPPSSQIRGRQRNIIRIRINYVHPSGKNCKTEIDVWKLFFTDEMILEIVQSTNIWIELKKKDYSQERNCKPTTPAEIKAVIGILYMLGSMKLSHANLEGVWSREGLGVEFFPLVMSLFRFKFLLRALRFDDINTREDRKLLDRLAPIRDIFEQFVENCQQNYVVSEFVTVDEMLEAFRGRCGFRQYIKSKPARYGVKIFAMCCAKTFYTSNLEIYAGCQPDGPFKIDNSGKSVVDRMVQPISGTRRNVTVDNWFSSFSLCNELLQNHQLTLVGTLRRNKREIPPPFTDMKLGPVGSSMFGFKEHCTIVSFKDKKNKQVILLSSMHHDDKTDNNIDSSTYGKPDIVLFYNSTKGGVDTVDKYKEHYSVSRISNRWTMTVFYSLLNIGALNAFIILKENKSDRNMKRMLFLQSLARDLCREHMLSRVEIKMTPTFAKKRIREVLGVPNQARPPPAEEISSGRCYICDWRKNRPSKTRCASCKFFICREHSAPVNCISCIHGTDSISDSE